MPATLSVKVAHQDITTSEKSTPQPAPDIQETIERFAEINQRTHYEFTIQGSSIRLARIISLSAASGELLSMMRQFSRPNMTYRIEPHIPVIRCENSSLAVARNTTAAAVIANNEGGNPFNFSALDMEQLEYQDDTVIEGLPPTQIGYFAMIPLDDQRMTRPWGGVSDYGIPTLNQLWVVIADHGNDNATIPRFLTCGLWNASLSLNISFKNNIQSVRPENFTYINEVPPTLSFGIVPEDEPPTNIAGMVYTAYFWGVCEQLTGFVSRYDAIQIGFYNKANIKNTVLTGAVEFVTMMKNLSHGSSENSPPLNRSLSALIEELSLNVSLNMLSDSYLSTLIPADVTYREVQNEYSYGYHNLVLAYGLAIFFTLISVLLGWSAYLFNGTSYDFTVSSIIGTSQNPDIAKTKLRFGTVVPLRSQMVAGEPVRHTAFGLEGTVSQIEKS
ncbi:hypothetical protein MMC22_010264 [Lobaria immixta]|nr:hypothetical protein [Lobaria immixta]